MAQPPFIGYVPPDDEAPRPAAVAGPWRSVTRWLIVINVSVFVIDLLLLWAGQMRPMRTHDGLFIPSHVNPDGSVAVAGQPVLASLGYFSVDMAIRGVQVWRFVTYQFVHANIEHIVLNMLALLLAGPIVEQRMGRGRYLLFYLVCGTAGPAAHIALSLMGVMSLNAYTPLVGASASIYGVLMAAAAIAPDEVVELAIPPIDLKLRTFALLMVALSLFAVTLRWQNAGGHAAHLGGALAGWFLSRHFRRPVRAPA